MRTHLSLRISAKLQLIVGTTVMALAIVAALVGEREYALMRDARIAVVRAASEQAISLAARLEHDVEAGTLSRAGALARWRDSIRALSFDGGQGYLFAYRMDGTTLVLPPTPRLEGESRIDALDADGRPFVREQIAVAARA